MNRALEPRPLPIQVGRGFDAEGAVRAQFENEPVPHLPAESRELSTRGRSRARFSRLHQLYDVTKGPGYTRAGAAQPEISETAPYLPPADGAS